MVGVIEMVVIEMVIEIVVIELVVLGGVRMLML